MRQDLAALQTEFKSAGADVAWVKPENLHLTLKFLGEIGENQVASLKEALSAVLQSCAPFDIHLEGIGAFPKTTFPRVIWVGVNQGEKQLSELAKRIEQACGPFILSLSKDERPFSPHLTIGRIRSKEHLAPLIKQFQVAEFRAAASAPVTSVVLFQSILSSTGPLYTSLAEIPLQPRYK